MNILSVPQVWHLAGTWSENLPSSDNLTGMTDFQFMMTMHSIFVPLVIVISAYFLSSLAKEEKKRKLSKPN